MSGTNMICSFLGDRNMVEKTMSNHQLSLFGTRGSSVRITPLRPSSKNYGNDYGNDCRSAVNQATIARFWDKVDIRSDAECWEWRASINPEGYGKFRISELHSHAIGAHRISYMLHNGMFPASGLVVRHKCDNRKCVNPNHLESGTHQDNSNDAKERGRFPSADRRGEKNGASKLTEAQVVVIKQRIAAGENNTVIANDYGVTHSLISRIRKGLSWAFV